jgi:uncharacterized protein (TIGR00369 family)
MSKFARQFMEALPYARALGLELVELDNGVARIILPYDAKLVGDPETGVLHGGVISSLIDTCCGAAALCHPKNKGSTATLDLRIEYMRAATPGQDVTARAECYHVTRNVAFVRATALDADTARPVACASGTFAVEARA